MRLLVADDDVSIRRFLASLTADWGYESVTASDGDEAWSILSGADAPLLAILDWNMPGRSGPQVIREVRAASLEIQPYLLLLTARDRKDDIVAGLRSGASDYIVKPFDQDELQARLSTGARMIASQSELAQRVLELGQALDQVKRLQGLLPVCAYCRKIRDDLNYWREVEDYLARNTDVSFTHCICPDCYEKVARPQIDRLKGHGEPA